MPRRTDIESIMIIGAGPIVIGQACEFDYSGAQACKALKAEGYRVILVNSNPATIMTDPDLADATYMEPLTPHWLERIIAAERPHALLPTMGGQTALNAAMALSDNGALKRHRVQLIGANADAIACAEDRARFRTAMQEIGLEVPRARMVRSPKEAAAALRHVGLPAILRPSFTLGGSGGGIAETEETYRELVQQGLAISPVHEVLVEESVLGWKEYEMEVVRDTKDNCILICSIENVDPMGVHTGDSVTVAPALTLTDKEYQRMRTAAIAVLRKIGVETGGSNVQFAVDPKSGRMVVIEMNPRVSRSSALASKATGFPIAKVAAMLAVGYHLNEIRNDITRTTPASFEPMLDYVVTKLPRFAFEKFPSTKPLLGTAMQSVGEVMSIGRNFAESLQKGLCSLETGLTGLNDWAGAPRSKSALLARLRERHPERLRLIATALRRGVSAAEAAAASQYDSWFVAQLEALVRCEAEIARRGLPQDAAGLRALKAQGFSDARLAELTDGREVEVRQLRHRLGVRPHYHRIDSCAGEFDASTPYLYSSYEPPNPFSEKDETRAPDAAPSARPRVAILGGGPNRIGQGIEFDYCCCHAAYALKRRGADSIMVNCNPETVSTDYDTSDCLYFEPLTDEHVLEVLAAESRDAPLKGVIVQFGGQTPLERVPALEGAGIPILGTPPRSLDITEDRAQFQRLLQRLGLEQPPNGTAHTLADARKVLERIGYPAVIRPSYVLGGRAMEIVHSEAELKRYWRAEHAADPHAPILLDHYLQQAVELDVEVLSDGTSHYVAGILQHIEEAGVHSGDSACVLPPHDLSDALQAEIRRQSCLLAQALKVCGLMNVQYAIRDGRVYVLEVNARASRTIPFVGKVMGAALPNLATQLMLGETLKSLSLKPPHYHGFAVKEAVLPFARFANMDTLLGPEMRSTGEAIGWDDTFALAYAKSQQASQTALPQKGCVFISVRDADKPAARALAEQLTAHGLSVLATRGTATFLRDGGVKAGIINKVREGSPHIVDALNAGKVQLLFNTTSGAQAIEDSKSIRRTALMLRLPYCTTLAAAQASTQAILAAREGAGRIRKLQA